MARKRSAPRKAASDGDSLFRAILADPDDDAVRLVYADWCEENGDPDRAEFIRLQIARARLPILDPARPYPGERERALLHAHGPEWLAALPERARECMGFERGFPGSIKCEVGDFIAWDDLWRVAPVTAAHLADHTTFLGEYREPGEKQAEMRALAALPRLTYLRTLVLGETAALLPEDVGILLASRCLTGLHDLSLTDTGMGDALVGSLCAAKLPNLRALNIEANQIGDGGAALLAASPLLGRLTSLCLGNSQVGDDGAAALAESPHAAGLEGLHLYCTDIGGRGALALAGSPHLGGLKALSLMGNNIGPAAQEALRARFGGRVQL